MNYPLESAHSTSSSKNLRQLIRQHPLVFFFLMAYTFSWIMSIPFVLSEWGILHGDFRIFFIMKSFGPFLAASIISLIIEGKDGLVRLRQRIRQTRAGWPWYLFILLGIPVLVILGIIVQPGALAGFEGTTPALLVTYLITYILVVLGGGPLGEEPGWRGFALPRMQLRFGPLWGTLLLGVLWTFWHLPDFLTSAQGGGPGTGLNPFLVDLPIFLMLVTSLAIILTWIFNHTGESVFIAILAHASVNTPQLVLVPLFPSINTTGLNLAAHYTFGLTAILIVILTRGRLGYPASQ
jgi:uncharacterized protein